MTSRLLAAFRQRLDEVFEPAAHDGPGAVWMPSAAVSLADVLNGLLGDEGDLATDLDPDTGYSGSEIQELLEDEQFERLLEMVTGCAPAWVVRCCNSSSMASGIWGLKSFTVSDRGYFYACPDFDAIEDRSLHVLGAWEPVGAEDAFRACFLAVHAKHWQEELAIPPYLVDEHEGPESLMVDAIERAIAENGPECVQIDELARLLDPASRDVDVCIRRLGVRSRAAVFVECWGHDIPGLMARIRFGQLGPASRRALAECMWYSRGRPMDTPFNYLEFVGNR